MTPESIVNHIPRNTKFTKKKCFSSARCVRECVSPFESVCVYHSQQASSVVLPTDQQLWKHRFGSSSEGGRSGMCVGVRGATGGGGGTTVFGH